MDLKPQTKQLLRFLQQRRRMDVLIFCYEAETDEGWFGWSEAKKAIGVADGTFRKVMSELEGMGYAKREMYDSGFKSRWRLTDAGCCIASLIHEKVADLNFLLSRATIQTMEICIPM